MPFGAGNCRVDVKLAEQATERFVAVVIEFLIAKEYDAMLFERLVDLMGRAIVERLGEIDALNLGTHPGRHRLNLDHFVVHVHSSAWIGQH